MKVFLTFLTLKGRHFRKKTHSSVYIQCRFNQEILTTDPVSQISNPIWDTELSWDVEGKALSFLRSQRASLKLTCHSIDAGGRRDTLGYIMLDLRTANSIFPPSDVWIPLVNARHHGVFRPEVRIGFAVGPKSMFSVPVSIDRTVVGAVHRSEPKFSLPVQLMDDGYYQIGDGASMWTLTITVSFAEHLHILSPQSGVKHHFVLEFLGTHIRTEPFNMSHHLQFPAERISIRLRGSSEDLVLFLAELSRLDIEFYRDNFLLGMAHVSLDPLLSLDGQVNEDIYPLHDEKREVPLSMDGKFPAVGVSLCVQRDASPEKKPRPVVKQIDEDVSEELTRPPTANPFLEKAVEEEKKPIQEIPEAEIPTTNKEVKPILKEEQLPIESVKIDSLPVNIEPAKPVDVVPEVAVPVQEIPPTPVAAEPTKPIVLESKKVPEEKTYRKQTTGRNIAAELVIDPSQFPSSWHQYRYSIDLRSIHSFKLPQSDVYCRYVYSPFGNSPVYTHPSVTVNKTLQSILLPNSFCAFEFVMSTSQLTTYLEGIPLIVELWSRSNQDKDTLLGKATIYMSDLLKLNQNQDNVRSLEVMAGVCVLGGVQKICELAVVIALEDFGQIEEQEVELGHKLTTQSRPQSPSKELNKASLADVEQYKQALQAKLELEFKKKENELASQAEIDWKRRETEREHILKRKMKEIQTLQDQLQKMAVELESRERKLEKSEKELIERREDLERDHQRKLEEARDAARRLHDEYKHKLELEQAKAKDTEDSRMRVVREREDLYARYKSLEREFDEYKRAQLSAPESALKLELSQALCDKVELERKLTDALQSKKHYKVQWVKALRELDKLKKRGKNTDENQILREKLSQSLMKEEKERGDEIDQLRKQLEQLSPVKEASIRGKENSELMRLMAERDNLLKSGYHNDDALIQALNERISRSLIIK